MRSRRAVRAGEGGTQELASSAWNSRICCGIAAASRAPAARLTRCDPEGRVSRGRRGSGASKFRVELADLSRDRSGFPCASGPADAMRSRGPGEPGKAGLRSWQVPRGTRGSVGGSLRFPCAPAGRLTRCDPEGPCEPGKAGLRSRQVPRGTRCPGSLLFAPAAWRRGLEAERAGKALRSRQVPRGTGRCDLGNQAVPARPGVRTDSTRYGAGGVGLRSL
jgi:hypothetical protein